MNTIPKRNIREDYLNHDSALTPFYKYPVQNPDFQEIIKHKNYSPEIRKSLVKHLLSQYQSVPESPEVMNNIRLLEKENTYTITTGHQLCLFGGPLFTLYKVLSVVNLTEKLREKYPDFHFVPVFWIHGEDHDFEEINHYYTDYQTRKTYNGHFHGNTGKHIINESMLSMIPEYFSHELKQAYTPGTSWENAYFRFFHALLQSFGVVILNADSPELKRHFQPVIEKELTEHSAFQSINTANTLLKEAGYTPQIVPREINLFYMETHGRNRIEWDERNQQYLVKNTTLTFSKEAMLKEVSKHPEKFSPNVCLRPVYQELILPNLTYIGGWAEVSYWLQLQSCFDILNVPFPLILPRVSATLWTSENLEKWESLNLSPGDVRSSPEKTEMKVLSSVWDDSSWKSEVININAQLSHLQDYITSESSVLSETTRGLSRKMAYYLKKAEKKLIRQKKIQYHHLFSAIREVRNRIQPEGLVQERVLSMAAFPFIAPELLVHILKPYCDPLDFSHRDVVIAP